MGSEMCIRDSLKTLSVGPVGVSNSRPPASKPGAQPSEPPVVRLKLAISKLKLAISKVCFVDLFNKMIQEVPVFKTSYFINVIASLCSHVFYAEKSNHSPASKT